MNPTHEKLFRYFDYSKFTESQKTVLRPIANLAEFLIESLQSSNDPAEVTIALRRLLEARDACLRALGI